MRIFVYLALLFLAGCASDTSVITTEEIVVEHVTEEVVGEVAYQSQQVVEPSLDVLLVIDDSCSMTEEQQILTDYLPDMYNTLETSFQGLNWRVGVTVADPASSMVGFTSYEDSNPLFELIAYVGSIGIMGRGEFGLSAAITSMAEDDDFHRPEAHLMVVFVSDEPDQSSISPSAYLTAVDLYKEEPFEVLHTAMVYLPEDVAEDCVTGLEQPGTGYLEVSEIHASLCKPEQWGSILSRVVDLVPRFSTVWPLEATPANPSDITVLIEGVENYDWTYDSVNNSVVLGSIPDPGLTVTLIYLVKPEE